MAGERETVWVDQKQYQAVGATLARARERSGLTQQQLAKLLRKPQSFVSNFERGQRRIDVLELLVIVEALGIDSGRVFDEIVANYSGIRPAKRRR
jgi:transcriptional regulator with XRE-family HTH domain